MQASPLLVLGIAFLFVILLNLGLIFIARGSIKNARIMSRTMRSLGRTYNDENQKLNELSELVSKIRAEENGKE